MSLDLDRVAEAASALPRAFVKSPQYRSESLSRLLGVELILKVETTNPTGSAASRGAEWWFECNPTTHRVVCASADDFGTAMAYAGRTRGVEVELFGPIDSDAAKVELLRHSGTIVRLDGRDADEARAEARRYSALVDGLFVDDGEHDELAEGSATLVAEIGDLPHEIDAIFVPVGRGSLAHGTGAWCHARMPRTRVVGVEMPVSASADPPVISLTDALDDTALVNDRHLEQASAALLRHEGIRASMDGSAALAAAALAAPDMRGAVVVVPVTGRAVG